MVSIVRYLTSYGWSERKCNNRTGCRPARVSAQLWAVRLQQNAVKGLVASQPELLHSCVPTLPPHPVLLLSSMRGQICECLSGGSPAVAQQTPELHTGYSVLQATECDLMLEPVKHVQQILRGACRLQGVSCMAEHAFCTCSTHASNGSRLLWVVGKGQQRTAACLCSGFLLGNVGSVLVWQHKGVLIGSCGQQQPSHLMVAPARCNISWSACCISVLIRCTGPAATARQVQM